MRDCRKIHPLLSLEAEGALASKDRPRVRAHLAACAGARRELAAYRKLQEVLRSQPEPKLPWDLHGKVMARLQKEGAARSPWNIRALWPLAAAAATTVFFFAQNPRWEEIVRSPKPPAAAQATPEGKAAKKAAVATIQEQGSAVPPNAPVPAEELHPPLAFVAQRPRAPRAALDGTGASNAVNAPAPGPRGNAAAPLPSSQGPAMARALRTMGAPSAARDEAAAPSWSGDQDPLSQTVIQSVITDETSFEKVWKALEPGEPVPGVDFTTQAVVFLEAGLEPTPGYRVEMARVEEQAGRTVVHWAIEPPPADAALAQQVTTPWRLMPIDKPSGRVVFIQDGVQ